MNHSDIQDSMQTDQYKPYIPLAAAVLAAGRRSCPKRPTCSHRRKVNKKGENNYENSSLGRQEH